MARPDIPAAKRAGLPVDLERLSAEGDGWLTPEDRYALKTHGICTQAQPGVFMLRVRVPGGRLDAGAARGLAGVAQRWARDWIHLTTRQQVELHHVAARDVATVLDALAAHGLSTRSTCGHTLRNVMACPDAGAGLDEPFDCLPDARAVSDAIVARSAELNCRLPSRVNILFGGCPDCRGHARVNDAGFVSVVSPDGELGYELWTGGSLGTSPFLGIKAADFIPRADVCAAAEALIEIYAEYGNTEQPTRARLKRLLAELGTETFLVLFEHAYERALARPRPAPRPVAALAPTALAEILAQAPPGGWRRGVRPQRTPGRALVTVEAPLGDLDAEDLCALADLAGTAGDGHLYLTRNQNVTLRDVAISAVPAVRQRLAALGLALEGAHGSTDVRACTAGPVCALAVTPAQALGAQLRTLPGVARNPDLRIHVSGCPNSCAQHQAADLGFSGGKVMVAGTPRLGYQVWVGGDLAAGELGEVVGRVADTDAPAVAEAIVGVWEALRRRGERLGATARRVGLDAFRAQVTAVFEGRWEHGPEPESEALSLVAVAG